MNENLNTPLVSVVMATFNESPTLVEKAVKSITNQTYKNVELLILDDSTSEETKNRIDFLSESDSRITVLREENRLGFVKSLNKGLKTAKGKYIARMDGDDMSLPKRIETQVAFLEQHQDITICGGAINIINKDDTVTGERFYPKDGFALDLFSTYRNPLAHPAVMFRKAVIDEGFLYDENLKRAEDLDLWLRLRNKGKKLANLQDKLLDYRVLEDLSVKRDSANWHSVFKVRLHNTTLKRPLFSALSFLFAIILNIVPKNMLEKKYKKENLKNIDE